MRDVSNHWRTAASIFIAIVILGTYVGAYIAMLEDGRRIGRVKGDLAERLPQYRSDAKVVELFFWPIHQLDRWIRSERWAPEGIP